MFTTGLRTTIHLNHEPLLRRTPIDDIATMFNIPNLIPALAHFVTRVIDRSQAVYTIGGQQPAATSNTLPPSQKIEVWPGFHVQMKDFHNPCIIHPPQMLCAWPPSADWPLGHFDAVLINVDPEKVWPYSKISGRWSLAHLSAFPVSCWQKLVRALRCSNLTSILHNTFYRLRARPRIAFEWLSCICSMF